jgi:hypothetical protein
MVRGDVFAEIGDGRVCVKLGWLGRADLEIANIAALSHMRWPWWGGLGVRLGRSMAAFTTAVGDTARVDLIAPVQVRAPLRWRVQRVIISVEDVDGFLAAVARAREADPVATTTASQ